MISFDKGYLGRVAVEQGALVSGSVTAGIIVSVSLGVAVAAAFAWKRHLAGRRTNHRLVSELIPLRAVLADGATIACDDGRLARVVEIDGADIGSMDRERVAALDRNREGLFRQLSDEISRGSGADGFEVKFLLERSRSGRLRERAWPEGQEVMADIAARWLGQFSSRYETRFYMIVSIGGRVRGAREKLAEVTRVIMITLAEFNPRLLGYQEKSDGGEGRGWGPAPKGASELVAFWNRWLNAGLGPNLAVSTAVDIGSDAVNGSLDRSLGRCEIRMNHPRVGIITFEDGTRRRLCRAIEIRQFPGSVSKRLSMDLMSLKAECRILLQTAITTPTELQREVATRSMLGGKALKSESVADLNAIAEERSLTWAEARLTVFIFGDTEQRLNDNVDLVRATLTNRHFVDVSVIGAGIELVWPALMPGRQWIHTRSFVANTVLAEYLAMFRSDRGYDACDFGDGPVAVFPTLTGELFRFIYHNAPDPEAPGHTVVIGGTGSGKTFLLEFLVGMSLRYDRLRAFIFDAMMGTYVFTNAVGGRYWSVALGDEDAEEAATLNPLQMELSRENMDFLNRWIGILADIDQLRDQNRGLYSQALEDIATAVDKLLQTDKSRRSLAQIFQSSFGGNETLGERLHQWVDIRSRGKLFNGATDSLDLSQGRIVSFDMTEMKDDPSLLRALVPYLIYRIRRSVSETKSPYIMMFEETAHMLRIPPLVRFLKEELQQARKRRGVVVMAFQEPTGITESEAASEILGNTYTQVFFPDPGARPDDYEAFQLKPHEFSFIAGNGEAFRTLKRPVLIRKRTAADGFTSVVVDIDMGERLNPDSLRLFKSGSDYADAARSAIATYGRDGKRWIPAYQEIAARIEREKRGGSGNGDPRLDARFNAMWEPDIDPAPLGGRDAEAAE